MFDFPNSPSEGTVFSPTGGPVYVYTGGVWRMQGSGQVVTAEARNRIVNGAMQIGQEYGYVGSANTATLAHYMADQWATVSSTSPGTGNTLRVANVTPNGSRDRIRVVVAVAKAALAAGDHLFFKQPIEGVKVADFRYGSAAAKQAVLRFGWRSPAGTYSVCLINSAANRSYVATFTVGAGQANTDTEQVLVIPGDTTGTWLNDTGLGVLLQIVMAAGTTWQGATGWQSSQFFGTSACTNGMATAGAVYELFDVGLYLDPNATGVPPAWQMPDEAEELRACQRYFCKADIDQTYHGPVASVTQWYEAVRFPVQMRTAPTMSGGTTVGAIYNQVGAVANAATLNMSAQSVMNGRVQMSFTSTSITGMVAQAQAISATARM